MPDAITDNERSAIEAWLEKNQPTACPRGAFTEALYPIPKGLRRSAEVARQKGRSTMRLIVSAHEAGHGIDEICRKHGISRVTVVDYLRRAGVV